MTEANGQGKKMQLNEYAAFFNSVKNSKYQTQYLKVGVDSAGHRHELVDVWETLMSEGTHMSIYCMQ